MKIDGIEIGAGFPPYLIAEMSGNHNQDINRAFAIVDEAAKAGVNAIKLQTYTADTLTLDIKGGGFEITDKTSLWSGKNLHDLYKTAYTPWEWHRPIMDRAKKAGITCFSSPFDETAVDFLEELGVPAYKIASFENNHLPLIKKAASTGKPLIISTGMATLGELAQAVDTAREAGCKELVLLKCTSNYPASASDSNIQTIPHMRELFECEVGLSDHTLGIGVAIASISLGVSIIEKHFTLSRAEGGVDSAFSLEPSELKSLVYEGKQAWESLGKIKYGPTNAELKSLAFRRSIYVSENIVNGGIFTEENIRIVRPGYGAPPSMYEQILGKKASKDYKKGEPLKLDELY